MEGLSDIRKKVADICKNRMENINRALNAKAFIAARVYVRDKPCGKTNCKKCASGERHGNAVWIQQNKAGKKPVSTTVTKGKTVEATEMANNYTKLSHTRCEIRKADREINELLNEIEKRMERGIDEYVRRDEKSDRK